MSTSNDNDTSKKFTLKPSEGKTVRFTGKEIASVSDRCVAGQEQSRWTDLAIYKTAAGSYVLWIAYYTRWQGEFDCCTTELCRKASEVVGQLQYENATANHFGELSWLDTKLIREAAEADPAFEAFATEEVE